MLNIRWFLGGTRSHAHLHAPGTSNSAMQKTHPLQHRLDELEFHFKSAIDHFLPGVPMRKIAIETQFGKPLHETYCAPHVLQNGGAMSLKIEWDAPAPRCGKHGFYQSAGLVIVFEAPADMQSRAFVSIAGQAFR